MTTTTPPAEVGDLEVEVAVIGAGIVGNCLVGHLARIGVGKIALVDKGPLPNPGGSTGHASNFIFPFEHSKMMTQLTLDSIEQYQALGVFTESGGIEVARTEARLQEFHRKMGAAKAWGIESRLLSPGEVRELVPYLNADLILGGLFFPTAGVVDSLRAGTLMREQAQSLGALTILASTEVTGFDVHDGSIRGLRTTGGFVRAKKVVICGGVWSGQLAAMAGASIPLTPIVHQMISVGPIAAFADVAGEIGFPIVRDVDLNMYERQHGGDLEVGSYAHRPIVVPADEIPSIEASALSPTELPFTAEDFDPQLASALELMPEILDTPEAGVRYAINGLISMTPDGLPLLGETVEVRGLWSASASWIKEGPSIARSVAEWMTTGTSEIDLATADIARFHAHQRTQCYVSARAVEDFNKMYGIVHPLEQSEAGRPLRESPLYSRERELGAVFVEAGGWERPQWYESNAALLERYADRLTVRGAEWDARWWSPIIEAEHLALRERVGLVDLSAFTVLDVLGNGAMAYLQQLAVAQIDVGIGRVVYTSLLDPLGRFKADLTIMRLGRDAYRVVTGGATGMTEKAWFSQHLPSDGSVVLVDVSSMWSTIGCWGPHARSLVASVSDDDVSGTGFRYGTCRTIRIGEIPVLASRISYVGEMGFELYVPGDQAGHVWDTLMRAGEPWEVVPVGIGVYGTTARLEKGYRAMGSELAADFNLVEADLQRRVVKAADFVGRQAHLAQRSKPPAALLCTLAVDYDGVDPAKRRYPLGHEALLDSAGNALFDAKGRGSYVTSAGTGPSVGRHLLMGYLPPSLAHSGARLAVECMGEIYPVEVLVAGNGAVFDPANERLRS